jgi:hypothetical protein
MSQTSTTDQILRSLQQSYGGRSQAAWYFLDRLFFQLPVYAWRDEGLALFSIHLTAFLLLLPISLPLSCSSALLRRFLLTAPAARATKELSGT